MVMKIVQTCWPLAGAVFFISYLLGLRNLACNSKSIYSQDLFPSALFQNWQSVVNHFLSAISNPVNIFPKKISRCVKGHEALKLRFIFLSGEISRNLQQQQKGHQGER